VLLTGREGRNGVERSFGGRQLCYLGGRWIKEAWIGIELVESWRGRLGGHL
jgi:hypothetical protein